jgi:hypothetical protein
MLRVFENRVQRGIYGPRRDEVTVGWRKLHNEELTDLHCTSSIVRVIKSSRMRRVGHVAHITGFGGKPKGKGPLGRPRHRWEGNIKTDLQEVGCGGMNWIELAQDREGGGHL